ncbi:MAG: cadherin-like beta sandwich domain-containing protein, partial [Bacteroidia bacterium]|nr:cadherin-like beta sandwich domain-containing protein [Bacteroidia bacterium]
MKKIITQRSVKILLICLFAFLVVNNVKAQSLTALSFNSGSSQFVSVPHSSSINLGSTFTIEAWVNYSGTNRTIIDKGNYDFLWSLNANGNSNYMGFYNLNTNAWRYSTTAVPQNTWTHVAITLSGGTLTFYINGVASGTASVSATQDGGVLNIGRQSPASCLCNHFNGQMDELRIWNIVRTQSELAANYMNSIATNSSGLVAYYKFDEGVGTTLTDATSNANNGTLQNNPSWVASGATVLNLLDNVGLGNTTSPAAYGLRKLSTYYTGSAIQVRRSSDNTTLNIGFTAGGNLDTAALKTFVGANNGFVSIWYDQSGNGRNATQTTNSSQPQIVSSGSVIRKNGNPTINFNGQKLATAGFTGYSSAFTLAIVGGVSANTGFQSFGAKTLNNYAQPWDLYSNNFFVGDGGIGSGGPVSLTNGLTASNGFSQWSFTGNSSTRAAYINGAVNGSGSVSYYGDGGAALILGSRADAATQLNGWISEYVTLSSVLNTTDRQTVENNQLAYYNSTNANLSALTTTAGTISPTFASGTTGYTASVSNASTSITVTPTRSDANATIQVRVNGGGYATVTSGSASGSLSLNVGNNTIDVLVTAQDGTTTKTYTITITRVSNDATLSGLTISNGTLSPTFASGTTSYTATNSSSSITITPTRNQANASIQARVNGGSYSSVTSGNASGSLSLNVGSNTIDVLVTAQDGTTTQTYTITVTRLSTDATLSALTLSSGTLSPTFASGTASYTASVSNGTNSVTITPTRNQANATIQARVNGGSYSSVTSGSASGSLSLNLGSNTINILVTAQDGTTTQTYTITVTRAFLAPGNALNFSSSNAAVAVSGLDISPSAKPTLMISVWVNRTSNPINYQAIVTNDDGGYDRGIDLYTDNNYHIFAGRDINTGIPSSLNTWEYISVLWSSSAIKMYKDGVLVFTTTGESASSSTTGTTIGNTSGLGIPFTGKIDELSIWNRELSISEVQTNWTSSINTSTATGLLAYYNFDALSGTTLTDLTSNGNNGSFVNSPSWVESYAMVVPPTGAATSAVATSFTANWAAPSVGIVDNNYRLDVSTSSTFSSFVSGYNGLSVSGTSQSVTGLSSGTTYYYRVRADKASVTGQGGYGFTRTVSTYSNIATLSTLTISSGTLSPTFASGTTSYSASVSNVTSGLSVTAYVSQANANIQTRVNGGTYFNIGTGGSFGHSLNVGNNTIDYLVTAQDGTTTQTYTIIVTRVSNDATLSALTLSSGNLSPTFASGTTNYRATSVTNGTSSITITPTRNQTNATIQARVNGGSYSSVTSGSASGPLSLNVGSNTIEVLVTAQDGTTTNTYTITVVRATSQPGSALNCVFSFVQMPTGLTTISGSFTAEAWVRPTTTGTQLTILSTRLGGDYSFDMKLNAGTTIQVNIGNGSGWLSAPGIANYTYTVGQWFHIACVVTSSGYTIYANGNIVGSGSFSGSPLFINSSRIMQIGAYTSNGGEYFRGDIDQVKIYSSALTQANIQSDMYSYSPVGSNLQYFYDFEDGIAGATNTGVTTLFDKSGNGYNGILNNFGLSGSISNWVESYAMVVPVASAATNIGNSNFTANWAAPSIGTVSNYLLDVSTSSTFTSFVSGYNGLSVSGTSQIVTGLSATTTYYYRVRADKTSVTGQGINSSTITVSTSLLSGNANLSALTISSGTLSPTFAASTTSYTASVSNSTASITVTPTRSDANATIQARVNGGSYSTVTSGSASGALSLNVGSNTIDVLVTAHNGLTTQAYTITVTRISTDATLSALTISSGTLSPTFASGTTSYTTNSGSGSVTITPTRNQANATIQVRVNGGSYSSVTSGSASGSLSLNMGSNTINVLVTAQDGSTTQTYTITATRILNTLDNLGLTGSTLSATAYSLRKLSSTYPGSAFQVRRSNDNATQDIGFTINGDLDTASLKTFVGANDGLVTIWYDQSGNERNLTQATTSKQPAIILAGVIYRKDQKPTFFHDASDDGLLYSGSNYLTSTPLSVNIVAGSFSNTAIQRCAVQGTSTWIIGPFINQHGWFANGWNHQINTPWSTIGAEIFTVIEPAATAVTSWRNGVSVAVSANNKGTPGKIQTGAEGATSFPFDGFLSETVVFNLELSTNERQAMESNQTIYYPLPTNNADLTAITISSGTLAPSFAAATTAYTANVVNATSSITITPTKSGANATLQVQVNGGGYTSINSGSASGSLALNIGSNTIDVKVTASDLTTTKTYTTTVIRNGFTLDNVGLSTSTTANSAFSLRKLSTSYNGSAIQVRRSSDNATQNIGFTAGGNLDTASLKTFVGANNGFVSIWYDQSGNGNNAANSTAASQPAIVSSGIINRIAGSGQPVITTATSSQSLSFTVSPSISGSSLTANAVAYMQNATANNLRLLSFSNGVNSNDWDNNSYVGAIIGNFTANQVRADRDFWATSNSKGVASFASNTPGIITSLFNGTNHQMIVNGIGGSTVASSGTFGITFGRLFNHTNDAGPSVWLGGAWEFIVFSSALSTIDRQTVESNQFSYYGFTNLSNLSISSGTLSPAFAAATTAYNASVSNATSSITVTPTLLNTSSTIQARVNGGSYTTVASGAASGSLSLNVGNNTVDVRVTARDGTTTQTYTVTVTRAASSNADLSALTLSAGTLSPTFANGTTTYTASVNNATNSITVSPTRNQANATIQARVNGGTYSSVTSGSPSSALSLNVGSNTINVLVTAQDGTTTQTYAITVTRETITWIGGTSSDFSNPANWSGNAVPTAVNDFVVASSANNPIITGTHSVNNFTINSGANLTVTGTLQIAGNIINNGTLTATSGTVVLNGSVAQTIPANTFSTNTLRNLTINNAAGVTLTGALNLTGILTPTSGVLTTGGFLILKSFANSSGSIASNLSGSNYISGNVIVERFVSGQSNRGRWRFLSSPVSNATVTNWMDQFYVTGPGDSIPANRVNGSTLGTLNSNGWHTNMANISFPNSTMNTNVNSVKTTSVRTYNEAVITGDINSGWENLTSNTQNLTPGRGFRAFIRGDKNITNSANIQLGSGANSNIQGAVNLTLTGPVNQGEINANPTFTSSGTIANDGWNLIGNPYPCAYNLFAHINAPSNSAFFANISPTVYVYSAVTGGYVSYNTAGSGTNAGLDNGIIPPGAAFFIKATGSNPVFKFQEAYKTINNHLTGGVHKTEIKTEEFGIKYFKDSTEKDYTVIKMYNGATLNNDVYDIVKVRNENLNLATYGTDSVNLTASVIPPIVEETSIKLNVEASQIGTYNFDFTNMDNFEKDITVNLFDRYTNKTMDVRKNTKYTFDMGPDSNQWGNNRFELILNKANTGTEDLTNIASNAKLNIYPNPATDVLNINISNSSFKNSEVVVYNISGMEVIKTN